MTGGIAIVGASESSVWTRGVLSNLKRHGCADPMWPINPGRSEVFGVPCFASIEMVPGPIKTAIIITNPQVALEAVTALAGKGVRDIVVVSNGFRETGDMQGMALEQRMIQVARDHDIALFGPNCLGVARFTEDFCALAAPIPQDLVKGPVSMISSSGAMLVCALQSFSLDGVGLDLCCSIGNGAVFDLADGIREAGTRETTRVVCSLIESIGDRDRLAEAIRAGRERGNDHIFLLLGQSEAAKAVAAAHTGAILGEGRLAKAWLEAQGVILVDSIPEMSRTAALLTSVGKQPARHGAGVMIVSASGGASGLAGDVASRIGIPLAKLGDATIAALRELLTSGAYLGNPLDAVVSSAEKRRDLTRILCSDPNVSLLLEPFSVGWPDDTPDRAIHRDVILRISEAAKACGIPYVLASPHHAAPTDFLVRERANGILAYSDLEITVKALAHLYDAPGGEKQAPHAPSSPARQYIVGEAEGRRLAERAGIPVAQGVHAVNADEVVAAAAGMKGPWVVKIGNAGVAHKGRIGGVRLRLCNDTELREACSAIAEAAVHHGAVAAAPDASFLLQQMASGPELLVSAVRDAIVGASITVGIGGWAAEAGHIFFTVPLPAGKSVLHDHVQRSALSNLLGAEARRSLVECLCRVEVAFETPPLDSALIMECNPVIMTAQGAVVADVLILAAASSDSTSALRVGEVAP